VDRRRKIQLFAMPLMRSIRALCKINGFRSACNPAFAVVTKCFGMTFCAIAFLGCATPPPTQVMGNLTAVRTTLATQFSLSGRFSAKTASEQVSGQFRYTQKDAQRSLNLFSPLGTPLAEIVASTDSATLTQASGTTQTAASLAALLRTVIDLPVTDAMMSAWLQGLPSTPDVAAGKGAERDAAGLLTRFTEGGWNIDISSRMQLEPGGQSTANAPRRMRWSLAAVPDTEVRWLIDEWSAP
jgi:outer membrane biogenesis lipoprotein LolB